MVNFRTVKPETFCAGETVSHKLVCINDADDLVKDLGIHPATVALHGTTAQTAVDLLQQGRLLRVDVAKIYDNVGFHAVPVFGRNALQAFFDDSNYNNDKEKLELCAEVALDYSETLPVDLVGYDRLDLPEQFRHGVVIGISQAALTGADVRLQDPTHEEYADVPELVFSDAPDIYVVSAIYPVGQDSMDYVSGLISASNQVGQRSAA